MTDYDSQCRRCKRPLSSEAEDTVEIQGRPLDNRDISTTFEKTLPPPVVAHEHRRCPGPPLW